MASTAKVLSSSSFQVAPRAVELRAVPAPAPRDRWGGFRLFRDFGGALVLAAWLALWTATWAAVAGPLAPAGELPAGVVQVEAR